MDADPSTLGLGALLAAVLIIEMRLLRKELKIAIAAIIERSRIRDSKRRKRETAQQPIRRSPSHPVPAADEWPEDESTDLYELMEIERQRDRARRSTDRQSRRGERPPRPGTHHDREE